MIENITSLCFSLLISIHCKNGLFTRSLIQQMHCQIYFLETGLGGDYPEVKNVHLHTVIFMYVHSSST